MKNNNILLLPVKLNHSRRRESNVANCLVTAKAWSDMKLIPFPHHHTVNEGYGMGVECIRSCSYWGEKNTFWKLHWHCLFRLHKSFTLSGKKKIFWIIIKNNNKNKKVKPHRLISESTYQCFLKKKSPKSNLKDEMIILFVKVIIV